MDDLEKRLTETLTRHSGDAPDVLGLAVAARGRARRRRRSHLAGAAVGLALIVGAAGAVAAWPEPDPAPVADGAQSTATVIDAPGRGWRWESWHGVTVKVPDAWGHGSLAGWCANGGTTAPRVEVPGGVVPAIGCTPASAYGLTFQTLDGGGDYEWPVVHQSGEAWPAENAVGARHVAGVLITVAAPTAAEARAVLDSARAIDGYDAYGCGESLGLDAVAPEDGMGVCRYDGEGRLVQSELLVDDQLTAAEAELRESATGVERRCTTTPTEVVRMTSGRVSAGLGIGGCNYLTFDDSDRILGADVLYWALSPGFSGDTTGLPLPPELRQE